MEPPIKLPRRSTLHSLRKAAIAASALYLTGFGVAAVIAVIPFDLSYRFEIAYAGLGALALGLVWQEAVLIILRRLVPIDPAMRRKINKYRWSASPFGDLMSILMLTEERESPSDAQASARPDVNQTDDKR